MFNKDKNKRDGLESQCRECKKERTRELYRKNPYRKTSENGRHKGTNDDYLRMLRQQDGVCAICRLPERSPRRRRLAIDHDHVTGVLRGLLCMKCNTSLGSLGDSIESIERVLAYLKGELTYD